MERAQKLLRIKRLLWVLLALTVLVILGFFLTTWSRFNGADVAREQLIGYYASGDARIEITAETLTHYAASEKTEYIITDYADDMLKLDSNGVTAAVAVLDADTLFFGTNRRYYYRVNYEKS